MEYLSRCEDGIFFDIANGVIKWFLFMFRDSEMTLLHIALYLFIGTKDN